MLGFARRVAFGRYLFLAVILAWCLVLARENVRCYVAPTHSQMTATLGYAEVCSCFIPPVLRHTVFPWWTDNNTWKDGCSSAQSWLHFGNYHLSRLFSSHLVLGTDVLFTRAAHRPTASVFAVFRGLCSSERFASRVFWGGPEARAWRPRNLGIYGISRTCCVENVVPAVVRTNSHLASMSQP